MSNATTPATRRVVLLGTVECFPFFLWEPGTGGEFQPRSDGDDPSVYGYFRPFDASLREEASLWDGWATIATDEDALLSFGGCALPSVLGDARRCNACGVEVESDSNFCDGCEEDFA